jgi:NTE family protein
MGAYLPDPGVIAKMMEYSLPFAMADAASRVISPYALGPLYKNPLERIVNKFRFDAVCADTGPALFICTTNVRTGKLRVFSGKEIHTDAILASACLPTLFQAVEIMDPVTGTVEAFWDGGFSGNPALFPMFEQQFPDDIVIVNINPLERREVPVSPQDIQNRINEISFNSSLLREMRAIQFVKELIADGKVTRGTMKDVLIHMIDDDDLMNELSVATKQIPTPYILGRLKAAGQAAAGRFLADNKGAIGKTSTVDLRKMFN